MQDKLANIVCIKSKIFGGKLNRNIKLLTEKEIKKELIEIIKKFDRFASENELKYSISSGTMLGAVRHAGFIPWDDDIDVIMLRSDYDKLVQILLKNNYIDENIQAIGYELHNSDIPFIKIVNKSIIAKEVQRETITIETYLWVDIFPLDAVPTRGEKLYTFYIEKILRKIYQYRREAEYKFIIKRNSIKNYIMSIIKKILAKISFDDFISLYIRQCSKYSIENCEKIKDITWGNKSFPKELMNEIVEYEFENIVVKGMKDYDTYLTGLYGNYMKLPKEEERINHGIKAWRVGNDEE